MLRRLFMLAAVVTVVGIVPAAQTAAAPNARANFHAKRACGISTSHSFAQCMSWVMTDAAGRPLSGPTVSGYGPAQFQRLQGLIGQSEVRHPTINQQRSASQRTAVFDVAANECAADPKDHCQQ